MIFWSILYAPHLVLQKILDQRENWLSRENWLQPGELVSRENWLQPGELALSCNPSYLGG